MTVAMLSDQETFKQGFLWEKKDNSSLLAFKQKHSIEKAVAAAGDEFSRMIALNEWTYNQFKIFGRPTVTTENALEILRKVSEGHTFYCAHYAIVYVVAATALGWTARVVSIRRIDCDVRGSNHNVVEIWSTQFNKWIMLDPTLNYYASVNGIPLNCYEIGREWFAKQGRDLRINMGLEQKPYTVNELPITLAHHPGYGNVQLKTESFAKYAFLAYVPTNRLLGDFADKSIELWDHWDNMLILESHGPEWEKDAAQLPPYYRIK
jgi:hypothetical protein